MARGCVAKPHTSQDVHVSGIRNPTWCSYVLLIVDSRNITGRHPPGNAYALSLGAVSVVEASLLPRQHTVPGLRTGVTATGATGPGPAHRGQRRIVRWDLAFPTSNGKSQLSRGAVARCPATNALARLRRRMRRRLVRRQLVSGIASPKILLTTCLDRGVRPFITHLQCDEHHTRAPIAFIRLINATRSAVSRALRQHSLPTRTCRLGGRTASANAEGSDLEAG